jgi:DnaK suppressor protein
MNSFSQLQLGDIQANLEVELRQLDGRIAELNGQDPFHDPDRTIDNAASDREASEESNHDRVAALVDELIMRRDEINQALQRITDGTYGTCVSCGNTIEPQRLKILPTATLCLSCEAKKQPSR